MDGLLPVLLAHYTMFRGKNKLYTKYLSIYRLLIITVYNLLHKYIIIIIICLFLRCSLFTLLFLFKGPIIFLGYYSVTLFTQIH